MNLIVTILPVVTKGLPISPRFTPYNFLLRCKFSTLTTRQPMAEFYLLTFPRFPLRKKELESYFGKNRTHDFRTSRCADYLLDHSGDEVSRWNNNSIRRFFYKNVNPVCCAAVLRLISFQAQRQNLKGLIYHCYRGLGDMWHARIMLFWGASLPDADQLRVFSYR